MNKIKSNNIFLHKGEISKSDRQKQNGHGSCCIWFTGLSGSGKSTLAMALEKKLFDQGIKTYVLDGDNIRHGLNSNLDFSPEDRTENIRRIGEVAKLFIDAGIIVLSAFISPYKKDRDRVRNILGENEFIEVFVDADIETCESRDPKGLYQKARAGEINDFTGISSPYERPENPEIIIDNGKNSDLNKNVQLLMSYLKNKEIIN
ncbi:putative adenylyl-sulfate kinase [bacterium BMS3Abin04]|nr:putative adenylyl-sulfate kinase [bacterium BMS3Abin04]